MFVCLLPKELKGIGKIKVYSYTEGSKKPVIYQPVAKPDFPLIGRTSEMDLFLEELKRLKLSKVKNFCMDCILIQLH